MPDFKFETYFNHIHEICAAHAGKSMEMFHNESVSVLLMLNIDTGRVSINSVMQD